MPVSTSFLARHDHRTWTHLVEVRVGLPVIVSCKNTGAERHRSSLPYESASVQGLEWALEPPLRSLSARASTRATAAADRTISFRQVAPQRQLDCRSGRSCRTKNLRRSCRTRGEQPRLSADSALTRYCRFCSWAFYKVAQICARLMISKFQFRLTHS